MQEDSMEEFPEWDVCRSLFDGHISESFEANLEYMWKKFGFCLPDADLLTDPEGLLKYLVGFLFLPEASLVIPSL